MSLVRVCGFVVVGLAVSASGARAQNCEQNFKMDGVPLMTALTYKSWQEFSKVKPAVALDNVARAVAAEGFVRISVNKELGAVSALQETTGSGRPQMLRMVVRKKGAGSRVDANFQIQAGQVTSESAVMPVLCGLVRAAAD